MTVDLTLLPFCHESPGLAFAHSQLECGSVTLEVCLALKALPSRVVPAGFTCFLATGEDGEPCYGKVALDRYGDQLRVVAAKALLALARHPWVREVAQTRAAWAYLASLAPATGVALYWH
jgi:hypothetical protein